MPLTTLQKDLFALLEESGSLRFGDFTLKSGARSPFFCNLGALDTGPRLRAAGKLFAGAIAAAVPGTTLLFGPAYKGIALATATASAAAEAGKDWAVAFDRKEAKTHGEGGRYIGRTPRAEDVVVLVDDVLSDGGTKRTACEALARDFSAKVAAVAVALDRRTETTKKEDLGLPPLVALANLADLVEYVKEKDASLAERLEAFRRS
jgi:orotate phosphoribosyltransferase